MPISISFTGLDSLIKNFQQSPKIVTEAVQKALGLSLAEVEHQSKERTPVKTGYLQGSIGGEGGYHYITGLKAGVGTNVEYAIYVERNEQAHHNNGQAHFMEEGVAVASPFIKEKFESAMQEIAEKLTQ